MMIIAIIPPLTEKRTAFYLASGLSLKCVQMTDATFNANYYRLNIQMGINLVIASDMTCMHEDQCFYIVNGRVSFVH